MPVFHLAALFARADKKVGTVPTCSREFFRQPILTNHGAGFLFSLRVAPTESLSGKRALYSCISELVAIFEAKLRGAIYNGRVEN